MSRTKAIAFSALGGAVAAVFTANIAFAEGRGFGPRRRGDGFFLFFPLLMLAAVAVLLVVLWRGRHSIAPVGAPPGPPPAPPASPTFNAQAILADRLARGEISPDDYRAAITVLRETPPPPPVG
jgi:putative membrane protein